MERLLTCFVSLGLLLSSKCLGTVEAGEARLNGTGGKRAFKVATAGGGALATGTQAPWNKETTKGAAGAENARTAITAVSSIKKDDLVPSGNCATEISMYCKDIVPGEARLLDCLSNNIKFEKAATSEAGSPVSVDCKAELRTFKVAMYNDIKLDTKMAKACKEDIAKYCDTDFLYPEPGNILACLREVKQAIKESCKSEVLRAQLDGADDFKLDPQLNNLCSADAEKLCKDVKPGGGRVQDCLRQNRSRLSWDCESELYRQEVENSDDVRLNIRLFKACFNEKKKFCPDVLPGDARVKDCLEDHRLEADFSAECKSEFDKMMERWATDFRLDSKLRNLCKEDIYQNCYPQSEDITDVANWDAKVIQCLQDFTDYLKDPKCMQQVHKLTKRAAEDFRFDKQWADACRVDRATICKDVPDGKARVFRCLQDHREDLRKICRFALFKQEVRFAKDIDFNFVMKKACSHEIKAICTDLPQGRAAVVKCLRDKVNDAAMGEECKEEVKRDQQHSAEDYRLNYRLHKACSMDAENMCLQACDKAKDSGSATCGGMVLKCLSENKEKLDSEECKREVLTFEKEVVAGIRLDRPLQGACKDDLQKFCKAVSGDHKRILACLRSHRDDLVEECRAEEMRFSMLEASHTRLTPSLTNACRQELEMFCKDVPSSSGQALECLQSKLEELGMGAACKGKVNLHAIRHAYNCEEDVERPCGMRRARPNERLSSITRDPDTNWGILRRRAHVAKNP